MFRCLIVASVIFISLTAGCESKPEDAARAKPAPANSKAGPSAAAPKAMFQSDPAISADPARPAENTPTKQPDARRQGGPQWTCQSVEHDFGEVWAGVQVRHPFPIENTGDQTLRVLEAKPQCACSVAENYTREIPPGVTGTIPFLLDTSSKSGPVRESLIIKTNDPKAPNMQLWMKGVVKTVCKAEVVADVALEDPKLPPKEAAKIRNSRTYFGVVKPNQRIHRVVRLTNTTGAPLSLTLMSPPQHPQLNIAFKQTQPGEVFELTIEGKPPYPPGNLNLQVPLKTNIPDVPNYMIPIYARIPDRIDVVPPKIVADEISARNKNRTINITNYGDTPFEIVGLEVSHPELQAALRPPNPANPALSTIEVTLPPGEYRPPPWGEVVRIHTNDPDFALIEISVLPSLRLPATPRPLDVPPIEFYPGKLVEPASAGRPAPDGPQPG